jgi:BirA family biotin operon repressor/biotin-[acetyl-CoA-carboxylase] ligase
MQVNDSVPKRNKASPETKTSTRSRVLAILRNQDAAVSGETMAEALGVSRVAVWKAVKSLNEAGYLVSSSPDGYHLAEDMADSLAPWEFGNKEFLVRHYDEIGSTMDKAREEALSGCEDGLVVLAERQTDGRGTGEKKWVSPSGGLFFTMVLRPRLESAWAHRLVLRAQLAMIDAIGKVSGLETFPGWPNDILLSGSKAGGILAETLSSGNRMTFFDLGIGINTGSAPAPNGISIPAGRKELLDAFLSAFRAAESEFEPFGLDDKLVRSWNARCPVVGKTVEFVARANAESGRFLGIDAAGWAIIERNDETIHCPPGSITLRNKGSLT